MNTSTDKRIINIATPIVWANHAHVIKYIENLKELIKEVNDRLKGEDFEIGEAIIDTYGNVNWAQIPRYDNINIVCHRAHCIEVFGMSYYWYHSIIRAFYGSSFHKVTGVLYYPVDACFGEVKGNTVSDPRIIAAMVTSMVIQESEYIMIGNYTSTNADKEKIERVIRNTLREKFPSLSPKIKRVRSEFWGISPGLFSEFETYYFENFHQKEGLDPVKDPTLLILLYCLRWDKKITPFDLGTYSVEDAWPSKKREKQISRAVKLIDNFLDRFRMSTDNESS